jgi:tRNA modification GTPase
LQDLSDDQSAEIAGQAAQLLRFAPLGLHLATPWRVVLAGLPNVGKSSLINALVGYRRSITVDMPGTTRDVLEAQTVIDGWPIRLSDTAGIRDDAQCAIETAGIESARRELDDADLILWVEDASMPSERAVDVTDRLNSKPTIRISNKIDRIRGRDNIVLQEGSATSLRVQTSATLGIGIDELRQAISNALVPEVPKAGSPIPVTLRQVDWLKSVADRSASRNLLSGGAVSDY